MSCGEVGGGDHALCVEAAARGAAARVGETALNPEQGVEASARVAAALGGDKSDGMKVLAKIELAGSEVSEGGDGEEPCSNP